MIKVSQESRVSQASGAVSIKSLLGSSTFLSNNLSKSVNTTKKKTYTPDETTVIKNRSLKKAREEKKTSPISFKELVVNADQVILELSKKERAIFEALWCFRNNGGLSRQRRSVIAKLANCTVWHVSRTTKKFVELGILCKSSETCWDTVQYVINPKLIRGALSFSLWFNLLSNKHQELYMDHGMLPGGYIETSIPKKRIIPRESHWKKKQAEIKKFKEEKRKIEEQKNRKERELYGSSLNREERTHYISNYLKESYLSKNQDVREHVDKHYVSGRSKYPVSRGIEMSKKTLNFDELGFSGVRTSIASKYELNASQKLKLLAFPISCLEVVFEQIGSASYSSLKGGYESFIYKCSDYCSERGMKPDFNRYQSLCKEYGLSQELSKSIRKPMYQSYKHEAVEITLESLTKELLTLRKLIRTAHDNPYGESTIKWGQNRISVIEKEIMEKMDESIH